MPWPSPTCRAPTRPSERGGHRGVGGAQALAIEADSADPAAIRHAVARAVERFDSIDVLVVNAGLLRMGTIDTVSLEDLDRMLDVNVRGVYLAIQAALPHLRDGAARRHDRQQRGDPHRRGGASVYQLTKTAVAGMVKGVALDLAPRGITVNNFQPGPTDTDSECRRDRRAGRR